MSIIREDVRFQAGPNQLVGVRFLPEGAGPHPALLVCHGPGEFKEHYFEMGEMLASGGVATLAFDMCGHGESEGERYHVVIREWVEALRAALDFVQADRRIDGNRLGAFGISSGGTTILETALVDPRLKALVLLDSTVNNSMPLVLTTFVHLCVIAGKLKKALTGKDLRVALARLGSFDLVEDKEIDRQLRADPRTVEAYMAYPFPGGTEAFFVDTIRRLHLVKAATMVIWGAQDKLDPPATARLIYSTLTCKKQLHIIPGNGHAGHVDRHRFKVFELTRGWLLKNFGDDYTGEMEYEIIEGDAAKNWPAKEKWERLSPFLKQHGREALAYATLQSGMEYFITHEGYLAYNTVQHPVFARTPHKITFSDPVCAVADQEKFLRDFLAVNPKASFGCVSETCAGVLRRLGCKVNCLGPEMELPIQTYNTKGNWKELDLIKRGRNEARREGITIREVDIASLNREELQALSNRWIGSKPVNDREIWIYARRAIFEPEPDVRKFAAFDREGKVCGFCFYDPMYRDGRVVSYSADISRCDEARYGRLATAIHMEAMEKFKAEGMEFLNLNLSPFISLEKGKYNDDLFSKVFFKLSERYGNNIYNFRGLAFHKSKYRGSEQYLYFASNVAMPSNDIYLAFHAADITRDYFSTLGRLLWGILFAKRNGKTEMNRR
jgi:alpha-beta hydrolase superfamily lysophospholipase